MAFSSQSSSQSEEIDERIAVLLKPIKDLTVNWEVPLADMLSSYIDDLQQIEFTVDEGQTVNFSQAALLLQGTASVYSKKVDFLWKLVGQALDMLSKRRSAEEDNDSESNKPGSRVRKKPALEVTREFELLEFDLAKNIDIKNEDKSLEELKTSLNFINVAPSQLIQRESSQDKIASINLYTGVKQGKWELLAGKDHFRINSQYVSKTGCLGETLNIDNDYLSMHDDLTHDQVNTNTNPMFPGGNGNIVSSTDVASLGNNSLGIGHDLSDASNEMEVEDNEVPSPIVELQRSNQNSCTSVPSKTARHFPQNTITSEPEVDPWTQLDPHEQVDIPRPIGKGKTFKWPPSLTNKKRPDIHLPPISEYLNDEFNLASYQATHMRFPELAPAFYEMAYVELLRTRDREAEIRRESIASRDERQEEFTEDDCDEYFYEEVMSYELDDSLSDGGDERPNVLLELPDPHSGNEIGPVVIETTRIEDENSYEVLLASEVARFLSQVQDFLMNSDLARRVTAWHEMIGPKLESIENKKQFDIHAYGTDILNRFQSGLVTSNTISFNSVVQGCTGEEIARYFLSTLMLTNTGNVELKVTPGSDPQLGMDNVMITLLSTARHHLQLEQFQAASQGVVEHDDSLLNVGLSVKSSSESNAMDMDIVDNRDQHSEQASDSITSTKDDVQFTVPEIPRIRSRGSK